jgi:hypothetical protein
MNALNRGRGSRRRQVMNATYGLEYALFFGVSQNKIEIIDGTSRWVFPFLSRAEAETHFRQWLETLRRWKQTEAPTPIRKSERTWQAKVGSIRMELFPRPIFDVAIDGRRHREILTRWGNHDAWNWGAD